MFLLEKSEQIWILHVEFCLTAEQNTEDKNQQIKTKTSGYFH